MVEVPEFEESDISYAESEVYDEAVEHKTADSYEYIQSYNEERISETKWVGIADVLPKADVTEQNSVVAEASQEEIDVISEEFHYDVNEPVAVELPYELVNKSHEDVDEAFEDLQDVSMPDITKERYEALTDKEKVEWLEIADCSVQEAIQRFTNKLDSIGVVYRYSDDMLDEFMRLESVVVQMGQQHNNGRRKDDADKKRSR